MSNLLTSLNGFTDAKVGISWSTDAYGNLAEIPAGQSAFRGARYSTNIAGLGFDLTSWTDFTSGGATIALNADKSKTLISPSGGRAFIEKTLTLEEGLYRVTALFTNVSVTDNGKPFVLAGGTATVVHGANWDATRLVDDDDKDLSLDFEVTAAGTKTIRVGHGANGVSEDECTITGIMVHKTSGSANPGPDNVIDNFAVYDTTNKNGVSAVGRVTWREGSPLRKEADAYVVTVYGDSLTNGSSDYGAKIYCESGYVRRTTGVGGHKIATHILETFRADFPNSGDNGIIVAGGINDIATATTDPSAGMIAAIDEIVSTAEAHGSMIVLIPIAPWKTNSYWTSARQVYGDTYNNHLRSNYAHYLADVYPILEDPLNAQQLLPAYDSGDGLHLSQDGFETADRAIQKHFPRVSLKGLTRLEDRENIYAESIDLSSGFQIQSSMTVVATDLDSPLGTKGVKKISRVGGADGHALYRNGYVTQKAHQEQTVFLRAMPGHEDARPGFGLYNLTTGAYVNSHIEIEYGPGTTAGTPASIPDIYNLSPFEWTKVRVIPQVPAVVGDSYTWFNFPHRASSADKDVVFWGLDWRESDGLPTDGDPVLSIGSQGSTGNNLLRKTLDQRITNSVSGTIKFRPQFNDSDDKAANARIFSIQGANVATDALEFSVTQSSGAMTLVKDSDNNSASVSSTEVYSRDDLVTIDFYASDAGIGWRRDGGAYNEIATANAQADWATDPLYHLALGSRYSGSHGANIIIEDFITDEAETVLRGYDENAGGVFQSEQGLAALVDGNSLLYEPWLYDESSENRVEFYAFSIKENGKLCVPDVVPSGIYWLKNVRSKVDGDLSDPRSFRITVGSGAPALIIGGEPAVGISEADAFTFQPLVLADDLTGISFAIQNQPAGSRFDTETGSLSWSPFTHNPATFSNIIITATLGVDTAQLGPFSITIVEFDDTPASIVTPTLGGRIDLHAIGGGWHPVSDDALKH